MNKVAFLLKQLLEVGKNYRCYFSFVECVVCFESMLTGCTHTFLIEVIPFLVIFLSFLGKTEFAPDEDAHVVGDCVKVIADYSMPFMAIKF